MTQSTHIDMMLHSLSPATMSGGGDGGGGGGNDGEQFARHPGSLPAMPTAHGGGSFSRRRQTASLFAAPPSTFAAQVSQWTQTDLSWSLDLTTTSGDGHQMPSAIRTAFVDESSFAALMVDVERMPPHERCALLRRYNAELEAERSTLAQIRVQLQCRVEEAEASLAALGVRGASATRLSSPPSATNSSSAPSSTKPTAI